jgi:hypothetical protein
MKVLRSLSVVAALLTFTIVPALADWDLGDGHKMHYPQLPDPFGMDVSFRYPQVLADDWQCSQTGPVSDVHIWFSAYQDAVPQINVVHVGIWSDIPADPTGGYSRPGELLWHQSFTPNQFTWRYAGSGEQGWYVPENGNYQPFDHNNFYQLNIVEIPDPFVQTAGTIYWLSVSVQANTALGWKTSASPQFNDTAVWGILATPQWWQPVYDPRVPGTAYPLDLAFVITPEPGTLLLLVPVAALLLRRR